MARKLQSDKWLFLATLALVCVSVVMVYSASAVVALERFHLQPYHFVTRQAMWALLGLAVVVGLHPWAPGPGDAGPDPALAPGTGELGRDPLLGDPLAPAQFGDGIFAPKTGHDDPDFLLGRILLPHHPADASAGVADNCSSIGRLMGRR